MSEIKNYKCPSCGDSLVFDGPTQSLNCESCGSNFTLDTMKQLTDIDEQASEPSKYDWTTYEPREFGKENVDFSSYNCPSCGATVTGDDTMGTTICPYCGNATIVKGQFEGSLMPDYIIPFKVDKKQAVEDFEKSASVKPFIPDEFKNKKKIEEMAGLYVPYWMFDCNCNANITYNAETITTWSDSNYDYERIDHYRLLRAGSIGFENIPVDGSSKIEAKYTEAVEPYDCKEAVNFDSVYLSGHLTDKYDVSAEECITRANERVKTSTEAAFMDTTDGYDYVTAAHSNISFSDSKIRYSLLPMWMLNIKYNGNMYKYAINGQTGKVVGEYPIDKSKKSKFFWKTWGITMGICGAIAAALIFFVY